MIIVVGGIKGGSGKTTISTNLTVLRSKLKKVLLVDADEQRSSSSWAQQREAQGIATNFSTIQLSGSSVRTQIQRMSADYDDIIVDVGGRDTTTQRSALTIADIYLVPFQPRSLDIWTLGNVKSIISEVASINNKMRAYAMINRGDTNGNDNQEAIDILKECPDLLCIPFSICQRKAFANAATDGLGITETKIIDKKAISEMQNIYNFIYQNDC